MTALAGSSGAITLLIVGWFHKEENVLDLGLCINGLLAGLVSTCSGVGYYDPWAGIPVGATGALAYYSMAWLLDRLRIDDPVGAAPVHLGAGAWGMLCVAFFVNPAYLDGATSDNTGIFFGGNGILLAWQLAAISLDFAWPMATCSLMFWTLNKFGWLRVSEEAELMGMVRVDVAVFFLFLLLVCLILCLLTQYHTIEGLSSSWGERIYTIN